MSKILAVETSAAACSVAILNETEIVEKFQATLRGQTQVLLPMVDELLQETQLSLDDLNAIAISIGPGSFTGIRVGISAVQGLTISKDVSIIAISSLQVLAQTAYREFKQDKIFICVNAFMGEVYWDQFIVKQGIAQSQLGPQLSKPEQLPDTEDSTWLKIGTGWPDSPDLLPHAQDLLLTAQLKLDAGEVQAIDQVTPVYLRQADAWKN